MATEQHKQTLSPLCMLGKCVMLFATCRFFGKIKCYSMDPICLQKPVADPDGVQGV